MAMTQQDIRSHYRKEWSDRDRQAGENPGGLAYANPVENAIVFPLYQQLLRDHRLDLSSGSVLDVGAGSGRWTRFFLETIAPAHLLATDVTDEGVQLLARHHQSTPQTTLRTQVLDITARPCALEQRFDLINIANVLFHIPEDELYMNALANLRDLLVDDGLVVSTEYLPRQTVRTQWMLVRSRYEYQARLAQAGLRMVHIAPMGFFANDPMGLDGPGQPGVRQHFAEVKGRVNQLMSAVAPASQPVLVDLFTAIERACLSYCAERIAPVDLPSQKLVLLARA